MKRLLLALTLALTQAWVCLAPTGSLAAQGQTAPSASAPDLRPLTTGILAEEVDLTLRALRNLQDAADGSYGGRIDLTQAALSAFALSHRHYRATDGPFVDRAVTWLLGQQAQDGHWIDADTGEESTAESIKLRTLGVTGLIDLTGGPGTRAASQRARKFLGLGADIDLRPNPTVGVTPIPLDLLLGKAAALLGTRNPDGSFGEDSARKETTILQALELAELEARILADPQTKPSGSAKPLPPFSQENRERTQLALARGAQFLLDSRNEDGLWGFRRKTEAGIASMAIAALQAVPSPRSEGVQQAIDHGLDYLRSLHKENGAIHDGQLYNYVTSAAVMALSSSKDPADVRLLREARAYLRKLQADEGEGYAPGDRYYGGVGYGGDERPDLSNLNFALEALSTGPAGENDEAFQKALVFLQRCQNYSETNDYVVETTSGRIESGIDGGATYGPGESKAGYIDLGQGVKVPRSYGSMSYALLRGYLFAGLKHDDPRVQVLWGWLQRNYTLDVNPGFEASADPRASYQGLFYYFFTMARALAVYGQETITDGLGAEHPWRAEIAGRLISMQRQDGSWINENSARWYEGNPVLATAYAMVTLGEALPH